MNILESLAKLDPSDDNHWTGDGMPRMDILQKLTRTPDLSRSQVTNAAPDFTRESVKAAEAPDPVEPEAEVGGHGNVMVEAVEPDVVAIEAIPGETVAVTPEAPEIATSAPEMAVPAPTTKLEALKAQLEVYTEAMNDASRVKDDADKSLRASSAQVNAINRQIDGLERLDPQLATRDLRHYIETQHKIRMDRAIRARRFMGNSGAKPQDVAKALEVRSPLDKAFAGRKPPRGTIRPVTRSV